jgi:hypothetical protein
MLNYREEMLRDRERTLQKQLRRGWWRSGEVKDGPAAHATSKERVHRLFRLLPRF